MTLLMVRFSHLIKHHKLTHLSACAFVTDFCCDRDSDEFELEAFFPGKFLKESDTKGKKTRKGGQNRPVIQRAPLEKLLQDWRRQVNQNDPLRAVRPASWILEDAQITILATISPARLNEAQDITNALNESEEWSSKWAEQIFNIISTYVPVPVSKKRKAQVPLSPPPLSLHNRTNIDTSKRSNVASRQSKRA